MEKWSSAMEGSGDFQSIKQQNFRLTATPFNRPWHAKIFSWTCFIVNCDKSHEGPHKNLTEMNRDIKLSLWR